MVNPYLKPLVKLYKFLGRYVDPKFMIHPSIDDTHSVDGNMNLELMDKGFSMVPKAGMLNARKCSNPAATMGRLLAMIPVSKK